MKRKFLVPVMAFAVALCLTACDDSSTSSQSNEIPSFSHKADLPSTCDLEVAKVKKEYFACLNNKWFKVTETSIINKIEDGLTGEKLKEELDDLLSKQSSSSKKSKSSSSVKDADKPSSSSSSESETENGSNDENVKCGSVTYNPEIQVCGEDDKVLAKCGKVGYDPETQVCGEDDIVLPRCGQVGYDSETQYCKDGTTPTSLPTCGTEMYNPNEQFCDTRDEKIYKTTVIDQMTWMAENLNYETNEESYCAFTKGTEDEAEIESEKATYCATYGRLYTWYAVTNTSDPICPDGWHVPTSNELATFEDVPGVQLRATHGWKDGRNGTDDFGFSVLPSGSRSSGGDFKGIGSFAEFWSATGSDGEDAYFLHVETDGSASLERAYRYLAISVRCVRD